MFRRQRPTSRDIAAFLATQQTADFSYPEVGATRGAIPAGYVVDRREIQLGTGRPAFDAACHALRNWKMFDLPWLQLEPPDVPIAEGSVVAIVARTLGLWAVGACRIVFVVDEPRRFGFAYGTLAHVERGEERFLIEWREDDTVWYSILAFSRPGSWLTWVGYTYARHCQQCFGQGSVAAMQRAVMQHVGELR